MSEEPSKDVACPACHGSGYGANDHFCGFCSGMGTVPEWVSEWFQNAQRDRPTTTRKED